MGKISKLEIKQMEKSSDMVYATQTIYSDACGVAFPSIQEQGKFFSTSVRPSQVYLSNFDNSYKMGSILGTSEFMSNPGHMFSLFCIEDKEDIENAIILPKPRHLNVKLQNALFNRTSQRVFSTLSLPLQDLSDFLFYSAGITKTKKQDVLGYDIPRSYRPFPSGGGMYATEIYLAIYHVENITSGIYVYQPYSHSLRLYGDIVELDQFIVTKRYDQQTAQYISIPGLTPSVFLLCMQNFCKQRLKYSELSLALAYTDCGCLLQNCGLLASALNLGFCIWAGFKKASCERVLDLDGLDRHVIMTALLGRSD